MKKARTILKWTLIIILVILMLFLVIRLVVKKINLNKSLKQNEISEMRNVRLGEYNQKILLEGKSKNLPLLVILHGGPAMPVPFGNGYRGVYKELTDNFVVINWDQYGCGNNEGDYTSLSIDNYVNMSKDLVKYLKKEFPNNELFLFGMSWGTILGARVTYDLPNVIDKYISYGTFTNMNTAYQYVGKQLLKEKLSNEEKEKVNNLLKQEYSLENITELQKISIKYNLNVQGIDKMDGFIYQSIWNLIFSPDYSIKNILSLINNDVYTSKVYEEINHIDVTDIINEINLPIYMIQGKYDNQTPHEIVNKIIKKENIEYLELEESGHIPTKSDFNKLISYIINLKQK